MVNDPPAREERFLAEVPRCRRSGWGREDALPRVDSAAMKRMLFPVLLLAACQTTAPSQVDAPGLWTDAFTPPLEHDTDRVHLEALAPHHAELDFEAFMGSREHLRRTLHWGTWPSDDYTVEKNRGDLQRHWDEFEAREGYAYTVQSPDGSRCVGCVYLNSVGESPEPRTASLAFWVVEDELENGLDRHLVAAVFDWYRSAWPVDTVVVLPHVEDERGVRMLRELGLREEESEYDDRHLFVWER